MSRVVPLLIALLVAPSVADDPPRPDPAKPVDYVAWLNERCAVVEGSNAVERYAQAWEHYVEPESDVEDALWRVLKPKWTAEDLEKLAGWVRTNEQALRHTTDAADMPVCVIKYQSTEWGGIGPAKPFIPATRKLAKLLAARARMHLAAGRIDDSLADVRVLLGIARHLDAQPSMITRLVAYSIREMAYEFVRGLATRIDGDTDYRAVLSMLETADSTPPLLTGCLLVQQVEWWNRAQRYYQDKDADGRLDVLHVPASQPVALPEPMTYAALLEEIEWFLTSCRKIVGQADYPSAQRVMGELHNPEYPGLFGYPTRLYDAYLGFVRKDCEMRALRGAVRVILELHIHRNEHGRWPVRLRPAGSAARREVRRDPFSGRQLVYRLDGKQPVLYSVGLDGKDNGGRWPIIAGERQTWWRATTDGDYIFWPLPAK